MAANIVLTRFMGTGKSTVGRLLADQLGFDFVDTDELIIVRDGRAFCLTATPDEIWARVGNTGQRPLLNVPDPLARIGQLLAERVEGYGRCLQIDTTGKPVDVVVKEIVQWYSMM